MTTDPAPQSELSMSMFATKADYLAALAASHPTEQPAAEAKQAEPMAHKVYLVATGLTNEAGELYERHEGKPPPLCDYETLYATPAAAAEPAAVTDEMLRAGVKAFQSGRNGWDDLSDWRAFYTTVAALATRTPEPQPGWSAAVDWLRNHYQDHPNIASLCDAMLSAFPTPEPQAAQDVEAKEQP